MILYKYRGNSEYTDKIFMDKQVWLSNAAALNDPFECTIGEIAAEWISEQVISLKRGHIGGFISGAIASVQNKTSFYGLSPKQIKEFLKKFGQKDFDAQYKTVRDFTFRKTGKELSNPEETFVNFDRQLANVGIFSLSDVYDNDLMWAHYAESSRGIAIGFEAIEGSKLANPTSCIKVVYSDDKPTFTGAGFLTRIHFFMEGRANIQDISFDDPTFKKAISTKKEIWSYEKEWRYIEERSGSYDFPGTLKEVIFGLNCPKEKKEHYIGLVNKNIENEVDFFQMVITKNSNRLTRKKYEKTAANNASYVP